MTWTDREMERKTYAAFLQGYKAGATDAIEDIRQSIIGTMNDNYYDEAFCEALKEVLEIIDAQEVEK